MSNKKILIVLSALLLCLLPMHVRAQYTPASTTNPAQEWQSTSTMRGSGSAYNPQISEVGAVAAPMQATTTEAYSPAQAPNGPRRTLIGGPETGQGPSPLGDALLPLALLALAYGFIRKCRTAHTKATE